MSMADIRRSQLSVYILYQYSSDRYSYTPGILIPWSRTRLVDRRYTHMSDISVSTLVHVDMSRHSCRWAGNGHGGHRRGRGGRRCVYEC